MSKQYSFPFDVDPMTVSCGTLLHPGTLVAVSGASGCARLLPAASLGARHPDIPDPDPLDSSYIASSRAFDLDTALTRLNPRLYHPHVLQVHMNFTT